MATDADRDVLEVPQGRVALRRHRADEDPTLRAWDAADEYVLHHLDQRRVPVDGRWLVVDDASGAVAVALAAATAASVTVWTDSHRTERALAANLTRNVLASDAVVVVPSTTTPQGPFDGAVVKVPRVTAHLDDLLRRLRPQLARGATVIGAGMTKAVHRSTIDTFEAHLGPTPTSLARKKARLLLPVLDHRHVGPTDPTPATTVWDTATGLSVTGMPNVFSSTGLDAGTRLLLDHLPEAAGDGVAVDLGCGTGVVAATLVSRRLAQRVLCVDESHEAIASARATVGRVTADVDFHVTDVLDGIDDASVDLVVVNPPFHAGGARTTSVARRMFTESHRILRSGGTLVVVGNRHLGHHVAMKRVLGGVELVASDPKFVVLAARRR